MGVVGFLMKGTNTMSKNSVSIAIYPFLSLFSFLKIKLTYYYTCYYFARARALKKETYFVSETI